MNNAWRQIARQEIFLNSRHSLPPPPSFPPFPLALVLTFPYLIIFDFLQLNPYEDLGLYTQEYFERFRHDKDTCKCCHVFAM